MDRHGAVFCVFLFLWSFPCLHGQSLLALLDKNPLNIFCEVDTYAIIIAFALTVEAKHMNSEVKI